MYCAGADAVEAQATSSAAARGTVVLGVDAADPPMLLSKIEISLELVVLVRDREPVVQIAMRSRPWSEDRPSARRGCRPGDRAEQALLLALISASGSSAWGATPRLRMIRAVFLDHHQLLLARRRWLPIDGGDRAVEVSAGRGQNWPWGRSGMFGDQVVGVGGPGHWRARRSSAGSCRPAGIQAGEARGFEMTAPCTAARNRSRPDRTGPFAGDEPFSPIASRTIATAPSASRNFDSSKSKECSWAKSSG